MAQGVFYLADGDKGNLKLVCVDAAQIGSGQEHTSEALTLGLGDALADARDRTYLSAQSYLPCKTGRGENRIVNIA